MRALPQVRVPASIGNMGSGFDALSAALDLYLSAEFVELRSDGRGELDYDFGDVVLEGRNLVDVAFRRLHERAGTPPPSGRIRVATDIPLCAGLGSSAAATVAGLLLAEQCLGPRETGELLAMACAIEGHPDNTSAALLGGLVGSCELEDGRVSALSTPWPPEVKFLVLTPELRLSTHRARQVLPDGYSRADAVYNLQRAVLLLQAIENRRFDLFREALRDRWHQPYRQALVPGLERCLALEHPHLLGVCLSGAGPSIVALAMDDVESVRSAFAEAYRSTGIPFVIRLLSAHQPVTVRRTEAQVIRQT